MENNIKNYRYKGKDNSWLSPLYNRMCGYLVPFISVSVSPNIITIIGASGIAFSAVLVLLFKHVIAHSTLCLVCFFFLFFYQMMDILDGQQAKRVGMYHNPTTELFDHGFDAVTTMLVMYNLLSLSGLLESNYKACLLIFLLSFSNFYLTTWEHAVTGIMTFKNVVSSPTDSIFITKILFVVLAFYPGLFSLPHVVDITLLLTVIATVANFVDIALRRIGLWDLRIIPLGLPWLQLMLAIKYNLKINIPLIVLPMLIAILMLIWVEITRVRYNLALLLGVYFIGLLSPFWGLLLSVLVYFGLFLYYSSKMCSVLKMKYFYTIPKNKEHHAGFVLSPLRMEQDIPAW